MVQRDEDGFRPYVSDEKVVPEFTVVSVLLGCILGAVFGVANAYLGLKIGMTVSASVPAAVISMAVLRGVFKRGTILENNISQTIGSSGEALAAGVIFTIPALYLLGAAPGNAQVFVLALLGGCLGILMMIPLRRYLIVREHKTLPFPEGTACAEILRAGDEGGGKAKVVFRALGVAALFKLLQAPLKFWKESVSIFPASLKGAWVGMDLAPSLLGVGFLIGPRIAAIVLAGGVLGYMVLSPLIAHLADVLNAPITPPEGMPLAAFLRKEYIAFIGVGGVIMGGAFSLGRAVPTITASVKSGLAELIRGAASKKANTRRTERDLPMSFVLAGAGVLTLAIWLLPSTHVGFVGSLLVVIFGFFFVTVASRLVGLVGSSANPVSGMTIATLLLTSLVFVGLGWTGVAGQVAALSVGAVVCIAVCMASDCSQDLKTGYIVGATPRLQQISEFLGVLVPALFMGLVLTRLHNTFGFGSEHLAAPQAVMMSMVVKGVMGGTMPWALIAVGMLVGLMVELLRVPALPFALGMYLPVPLSTPIMIGGLIRWWIGRRNGQEESGVLCASGMVAGDALMGVGWAFIVGIPLISAWHGGWLNAWSNGSVADFAGLFVFLGVAAYLWRVAQSSRQV